MKNADACFLCPRECGARRGAGETGACGAGGAMRVSRIALHPYEEPIISGKRGSGTVFFCGCSLGCVFCQNKDISRGGAVGVEYTPEALCERLVELEAMGAHNINLVTAAHFVPEVAKTLELAKKRLTVPVVYNSSGYEKVETLKLLDGLVDVYLPDFKYFSSEIADKYSSAPDYKDVATAALCEMHRQVGRYELDGEGIITKGMVVRHLVLPACRADSMAVLKHLASILPTSDVLLSLMSQYTPEFALDSSHKELHRRLTSFEYSSVASLAESLGFDGFFQRLSSATSKYTPDFNK